MEQAKHNIRTSGRPASENQSADDAGESAIQHTQRVGPEVKRVSFFGEKEVFGGLANTVNRVDSWAR